MKVLYLVRHAKSSWAYPELADIDRPLNDRGKRDAPFMARQLASRGLRPDALLVSPARRTRDTARFFAEALAVPAEAIHQHPDIYEAGTNTLQKIINELSDQWQFVLLFGHNPGFTYLANLYTQKVIENVPTCGIVTLSGQVSDWRTFGPNTASVTDFIYPKLFNRK